MNKKELLILSWENLWRSKFRTILTIIGVVIGTASIVIMVSIGTGAQESIMGEFSSSAITSLQVYPDLSTMNKTFGGISLPSSNKVILNDTAIKNIKRIDGVIAVTPTIPVHGAEFIYKRKSYTIIGNGYDYKEIGKMRQEVSVGKMPRPSETNSIVLGAKIFTEFDIGADGMGKVSSEKDPSDLVGKQVAFTFQRNVPNPSNPQETIVEKNTRSYRIAGILKATGGQDDYGMFMDIKEAKSISEWQNNKPMNIATEGYTLALVTVENAEKIDAVTKAITDIKFRVFSMKQMLSSMKSILATLQLILGGIGGVSLLVASIGIINTMTMSIYERTKEIGIMKVIGASISDIRNMFIVESTIIGLIGGVVGVVFSLMVSALINVIAGFAMNNGDPVKISVISPGLVLFAMCFSALVGTLSGTRPAAKAASLSALDAIRTE